MPGEEETKRKSNGCPLGMEKFICIYVTLNLLSFQIPTSSLI